MIFVAEKNGRIIGFIAGIIQKQTPEELLDSLPARAGRVIELYVSAECRGGGTGKTLTQNIENYFIRQKCDLINIEVFAPNHHAHAFYQRLGYANRNIDLIKELK